MIGLKYNIHILHLKKFNYCGGKINICFFKSKRSHSGMPCILDQTLYIYILLLIIKILTENEFHNLSSWASTRHQYSIFAIFLCSEEQNLCGFCVWRLDCGPWKQQLHFHLLQRELPSLWQRFHQS